MTLHVDIAFCFLGVLRIRVVRYFRIITVVAWRLFPCLEWALFCCLLWLKDWLLQQWI